MEVDNNNYCKTFCENFWRFDFSLAKTIINAESVHHDKMQDLYAHGLSIDSRDDLLGKIFLARKGELTDGHKFLDQAFKKGASFAIIEKDYYLRHKDKVAKLSKFPLLIVDSSEDALEKLASFVAENFAGKKIAVTGSLGKTTFKNILAQILSDDNDCQVFVSKKSYNNFVGVCLSLLNMSINCKYAIFEMGMNHRFEILKLCKIVGPHLAIITNTTNAHIGYLGSLEEIIYAKGEILESLNKNAKAIIPSDNKDAFEYFKKLLKKNNHKFITFGSDKDAKVEVCDVSTFYDEDQIYTRVTLKIDDKNYEFKLPSLGLHWGHLIACSVACYYSLNDKFDYNKVLKKITQIKPLAGRGRIHKLKRGYLIDDSYNASPNSVENTINSLEILANCLLANKKSNKHYLKVLILGDMLELGRFSKEAHENLFEKIIQANIDQVVLVGKETKFLKEKLKKNNYQFYQHFDRIDELLVNPPSYENTHYLLAVKGSKAIELDKLIPIIIQNNN